MKAKYHSLVYKNSEMCVFTTFNETENVFNVILTHFRYKSLAYKYFNNSHKAIGYKLIYKLNFHIYVFSRDTF